MLGKRSEHVGPDGAAESVRKTNSNRRPRLSRRVRKQGGGEADGETLITRTSFFHVLFHVLSVRKHKTHQSDKSTTSDERLRCTLHEIVKN